MFSLLSRNKKSLLTISLLFLIVSSRIAYLYYNKTYAVLSYAEMERAAANLAREGSIGNVYSYNSGKSAHVAPLYPLFLSGIYKIFGWNSISGRIAQEACAILATALGICLLPFVARKTNLPESAGWIAAFAMALLPLNLWVETSGSWEQPFAALLLIASLLSFCSLRDENWSRTISVVYSGLLVGGMALLSPALLPAGLLMFLAELMGRQSLRKRVLKGGLLMLAVATVAISPWVIRNYLVFGHFIPLRSNLGLELMIGNNPLANGKTYITSADDPANPMMRMHPYASVEERERLIQMGEANYMNEKKRASLQWIRDNPQKAAGLTFRRFLLFWFPDADLWSPSTPQRSFKSLAFCSIGILFFCDLIRLLLLRHSTAWLFAGAIIGPSLIYMITHVDPRYRYPLFGLSLLLACDIILAIGKFIFYRRKPMMS